MSKTVRIIGIPMDLGQQHRGVDMGPVAIRYAGLSKTLRNLGYQIQDAGNIEIPGHYTLNGQYLLGTIAADSFRLPKSLQCRLQGTG